MHSKESNSVARLSAGWVSLNRAAKLLGISYPTVVRLRRQGRIKTIRIGGIFRVYTDEIRRIAVEGTSKIVADVETAETAETVNLTEEMPEEQFEEEVND